MKDETELFNLTTSLLETVIDPMARREGIGPADVGVMMVIMLGRIAGKMGYRNLNGEQYWDTIVKHSKSLFLLGFDSERQHEN